MKEEWVENVVEVDGCNGHMIRVKLVYGKKMLHFISAYAPQQGKPKETKEQFLGTTNMQIKLQLIREVTYLLLVT